MNPRMNRKVGCAVVALLLVLPCASFGIDGSPDTSHSQYPSHYWLIVGGGFADVSGGLGEDDGGISAGGCFSYQRGASLYSLRAVSNSEFKLDLWGYSGPPDVVWDAGLLYGGVVRSARAMFAVAGGVALAGVSHNYLTTYHPGIAADVQVFWTPCDFLGLGLYGFADINRGKSFYGMLFAIQLIR